MRSRNYSEEYISAQMNDFNEFAQVVDNVLGYDKYSADTIAILYTVMKLEIPRENSDYPGY